MHDDAIITSFETLYDSAKAGGVVTAQQAQLVLSYGASLLRRRDARLTMLEEARDEVAIALAGRAKPVFGFVATKEVCEVQSKRGASTELRGSINGAVALMGG